MKTPITFIGVILIGSSMNSACHHSIPHNKRINCHIHKTDNSRYSGKHCHAYTDPLKHEHPYRSRN